MISNINSICHAMYHKKVFPELSCFYVRKFILNCFSNFSARDMKIPEFLLLKYVFYMFEYGFIFGL